MPASSSWSRPVGFGIYALLLIWGVLSSYYPTIDSNFRQLQTDPGDPVLNHYFLEHTYRWISQSDYKPSFWSPSFYHPQPLILAYSETLIGAAPPYWVFRQFTDEVTSFQLWMIFLSVTNYLAMLIVLRWLGISSVLAAVLAYVYAFSMPRLDQFNHHHLQPHAYAPFAVYAVYRLMHSPSRTHWAVALLTVAGQILASFHLGWGLSMMLFFWFTVNLATQPAIRQTVRTFVLKNRAYLTGTLLVWMALMGWYFYFYYLGNKGVRRDYGEVLYFMPYLSGWFAMPKGSFWELSLVPFTDAFYQEKHLFFGFTFLCICLATLVLGCQQLRMQHGVSAWGWAIVLAFLACLIATRFGEKSSAWWLVHKYVPGGKAIRTPGRIVFTALLMSCFAAGWFLDPYLRKLRSRSLQALILLVLLFGILVENRNTQMCSFEHAPYYAKAKQLQQVMNRADAVYVVLDRDRFGEPCHNVRLSMWGGLWANMPIVNGYSGRSPEGFPPDEAPYSLESLLHYMGEDWQGTLLILTWESDTNISASRYRVEPGKNPYTRYQLMP